MQWHIRSETRAIFVNGLESTSFTLLNMDENLKYVVMVSYPRSIQTTLFPLRIRISFILDIRNRFNETDPDHRKITYYKN